MTLPTSTLGRVADLRQAFDQAFSETPRAPSGETLDVLAIRVAGDPYALQVSELSGLVSDRKIVPLPSLRAELLGIAGIRGSLVPVYGLAVLLGHGPSASPTPWLALSGGHDPVALAFEELEGFLRLERTDLHAAVDASRRHVTGIVRIGNITRRVIDTRGAIAALGIGAGRSGSTKEQ